MVTIPLLGVGLIKNRNYSNGCPILVKNKENGDLEIGFLKSGRIVTLLSLSENDGVKCWGEDEIPPSFRRDIAHHKMAKLFYINNSIQIEYLQ